MENPAVRVDDVLCAELLDDSCAEHVDREYLRKVFREPQRYLPPPRVRAARRLDEQPELPPESPLARRSKLTALVLAGVLFSGSVVTAALLAGQQEPREQERLEITGPAALGGFAVPGNSTAGSGGGPADPATAPGPSTAPDRSATTEPKAEAPRRPASASAQGGTEGTSTQRADGRDRLALVGEFYERVRTNPQDALALLDPILAGKQPEDLVAAWRSMSTATVESLREQADGSVLAVVSVVQPDGRVLRVTQLLEFTDGEIPLISQAKLVSAQHG